MEAIALGIMMLAAEWALRTDQHGQHSDSPKSSNQNLIGRVGKKYSINPPHSKPKSIKNGRI